MHGHDPMVWLSRGDPVDQMVARVVLEQQEEMRAQFAQDLAVRIVNALTEAVNKP